MEYDNQYNRSEGARSRLARRLLIKSMQVVNRTLGVDPAYKEAQRRILDANYCDFVLNVALDRLLDGLEGQLK